MFFGSDAIGWVHGLYIDFWSFLKQLNMDSSISI